jgi:hypothetical protein
VSRPPHRDYLGNARAQAHAIRGILDNIEALRFAHERIYPRSSSINLFNGMVSLTFSGDGSDYMTWDAFRIRSVDFWTGSTR